MSRRVDGEGPRPARIAIVGEAPGETEDRDGRPFVGSSGRYLNRLLSEAGIDRSQCYVTNVVKYRPPNNDFGIYYRDASRRQPTDGLLEARRELIEELREVQPRVVIALGAEALRALTPHHKISKWRGSVIESEELGCRIVPTYHPSYLFRSAIDRPIAVADIRKAARHAADSPPQLPVYDFLLGPDFGEAMAFLQGIQPGDTIAFDIETSGDLQIRCIGFAVSEEAAACIPLTKAAEGGLGPGQDGLIRLDHQGERYWNPEEEQAVMAEIRRVLTDPQIRKIAQNYAFDATVIGLRWDIDIAGLWMDTMHLFHALWPELPKSLDFLTSLYTDQPYYADRDSSVDMEEWRYNAIDCCITWTVAQALRREADELGMWEFYKNHIEPAMYGLTRMQNRGVRINPEARELMRAVTRDRKTAALARLRELTGNPEFNPNSSRQVIALLYGGREEGGLGLPRQFHRKTASVTASEEALLRLRRGATGRALEVIRALLEYRGTKKGLEYYDAQADSDGRMRTAYNVSGTVNGRISSSKSILGSGMNLQQVPKRKDAGFRRMFVADPGYRIVKVDLSQAEVRVVAWIAPLPYLQDRFLNDPDFDIHRWNAANIYRVEESEVTKEQRNRGKIGVHGGNYGLGPRGASAQFNVPYREAETSLEAYRAANAPHLQNWWKAIREEVNRTRTLTTPLGRRRTFLGRLDDSTYRSAYSFIPQAMVGDIILRALAWAELVLEPEGGQVLLQVHDELVFQVREDALDTALPKIRALMEPAIPIPGQPDLVIPCEIEVGDNWAETEPVEVPPPPPPQPPEGGRPPT